MAATARLELRVRPRARLAWSRRRSWSRVALSDFVRSAAEERADEVLRDHQTQTLVPAAFFDELLANAPASGNCCAGCSGRPRALC